MANVAEHDAEQERERDASEQSWVHLFILGHVKQVDDHLKRPSELVRDDVGRWTDILPVVLWIQFEEPGHFEVRRVLFVDLAQLRDDFTKVTPRDPAEAKQQMARFGLELVESRVDQALAFDEELV